MENIPKLKNRRIDNYGIGLFLAAVGVGVAIVGIYNLIKYKDVLFKN